MAPKGAPLVLFLVNFIKGSLEDNYVYKLSSLSMRCKKRQKIRANRPLVSQNATD